ncbi:MAG TPA: DUF4350 domain-containing protein [Acidobacteriaceae bacterium]|jgi:hypothetical protein|nr:DUF4350 domain-containing protein [Acidobacteriaceae bacterium]
MKKLGGEWKFLLIFTSVVVLLIVITGILAPSREDRDATPSTWNSGRAGAKAAWLLLGRLGYHAVRWDRPEAELSSIDAAHATLVLAEPSLSYSALRSKENRPPIADFLHRGGRIVATGEASALLLPDATVAASDRLYTDLCYTVPQGPSQWARAGQLSMAAPARWAGDDPSVRIAQQCGTDAVVVSYPAGAGTVIWWASATPLSNLGLHEDGNLRLLLASIGGLDRTVYFDEYIHGDAQSPWSTARGTPLTGLMIQCCCVAALLLYSFSRGSGPRRALVQPPRTSPLEFVESMGALYAKAGAGNVAIGAAMRRLTAFLAHDCGLPPESLRSGPAAIASAVATRFGCDASSLAADLEGARQAEYDARRPSEALALVNRLDRHIAILTHRISNPQSGSHQPQGTA